jgi:hypothetical protein
MVDDHERDRHQERRPVLVQGQHPDHHEEVEVRLGDPTPQIDEHGRAGHEPERRRDYARLQPESLEARSEPAQSDQRDVDGHVRERVVPDEHPEREQRRDVQPQQPADRAVALEQDVVGEQLTLGKPVLQANPLAGDPGAGAARPGIAGAIEVPFDRAADHRGRRLLGNRSAGERAHRAMDDFA